MPFRKLEHLAIGAEIVELEQQTDVYAEVLGSEASTCEIDEPHGALLRYQSHGVIAQHRGNTGTCQQPFDRRTDRFSVIDVAQQDRYPDGLDWPLKVARMHSPDIL